MNWHMRGLGLALAAALAASAGAAKAESPEEFYKGETLTFVVGFGPGGGFDTFARILAPHIAERIGGTVIVENRPGAGGTGALNQMVRGDQDGREIDIVHGEAALLTQLTDQSGRRFDVKEFNWLGRIASEPGSVLISAKSPYGSIEDLKGASAPIKFAAGSKADGLSDFAAVFCETLSLQCKIITGYKGSKESSLAAIRGETDAIAVEANTGSDLGKGGELKPVAVLARKRWKTLPDTPTLFEAAAVPADKEWWIDFRESVSNLGRSLAMGPGVPQDRVDYMRKVVEDVLTDPKVIADVEKTGREINYLPGTEQKAIIDQLMQSVEGDRLEQVKTVLLEKYF
ncbi:tripartite tricarboxylate transporter substrate-binding protein [Propylenella binzhouense]|nr:tripartite tricarboxylate transporter substrate-binding protein [Propylenella binzhouense]